MRGENCFYKSWQNPLREGAQFCFTKPWVGRSRIWSLDAQSSETNRKLNDSAYSSRETGDSWFNLEEEEREQGTGVQRPGLAGQPEWPCRVGVGGSPAAGMQEGTGICLLC